MTPFTREAVKRQIRSFECGRNITRGCDPGHARKADVLDEEDDTPECLECAEEWNVRLARVDFNYFAQMVSTDDETGLPLKQAPIHQKWAELCEKYDRLLIWSHINSGKTTQLSILRTVWELGKDPTLRFVILSNTASIATKIVKAIANYIEHNKQVHRIFPGLKPDLKAGWTNTELTVVRPSQAKDPSVRAVGVHGALTSGRVDRLIVDDILDPENTDTEANRRKVEAWYKAVAVGRLTRRAKILVVGTAYHPNDLLHTLAEGRRWKAFRFPIFDAVGNIAWPEAWSPERIEQMREELGPAEFARQLLCKARDDDEARFKKAWIDEALKKGNGLKLVRTLAEIGEYGGDDFSDGEIPDGWRVFCGVDLAVKKTKKADLTAFFVFLEDPKGNRRLLMIETGKFTGPEILQKIDDFYQRYQCEFAVENNAAQDFVLQFAREGSNVPIHPHTTSKAKRDPILGVEGLAVELANGKWAIPNDYNKLPPDVLAWVEEMLFFSPKTHTGDRLMAAYFARELARKRGNKYLPGVTMRVIGQPVAGVDGASDGPKVVSFAERMTAANERARLAHLPN